jgi:hypothetical protein
VCTLTRACTLACTSLTPDIGKLENWGGGTHFSAFQTCAPLTNTSHIDKHDASFDPVRRGERKKAWTAFRALSLKAFDLAVAKCLALPFPATTTAMESLDSGFSVVHLILHAHFRNYGNLLINQRGTADGGPHVNLEKALVCSFTTHALHAHFRNHYEVLFEIIKYNLFEGVAD